MTGTVAMVKLLCVAAGSSVLTVVVSKRLNKRTDEVKVALLEQDFYKNLVSDYEKELKSIKGKLSKLVEQNDVLIKRDIQNIKIIEEQNINLKKWENYCEELKRGIKERDVINGLLVKEIEDKKN